MKFFRIFLAGFALLLFAGSEAIADDSKPTLTYYYFDG